MGFRYFAAERARSLHLAGVVRNLRNGDVQVVAEGEKGALEAFLVALRLGPSMSRVDEVIEIQRPATGEYTTFSIAPTR